VLERIIINQIKKTTTVFCFLPLYFDSFLAVRVFLIESRPWHNEFHGHCRVAGSWSELATASERDVFSDTHVPNPKLCPECGRGR
jgi:hypothetical protein